MRKGSIVICNALLGTVIASSGKYVTLVDKYGKEHKVVKSLCTEVCNPHALACLLYQKVVKR